MTKADLVDRVTKLQARRDERLAQCKAEIGEIDRRLTLLTALVSNWDTVSLDQALTMAANAGLIVRVDA